MEGYIAEIRMFAGNFEPRNWAYCSGQLLSIASNTALFSLLGTTYGGNGTTTFALPDLRGRAPFGTGTGSGLPVINLGEVSGSQAVTLGIANLPSHTHPLSSTNLTMGANAERVGTTDSPVSHHNSILGGSNAYSSTTDGSMASLSGTPAIGVSGSNNPINIRSPYLGINYIICLLGTFPIRN
ncbi:MAG: phage tail protein [Chitinophagaceae bacterium]